MQVEEAKKKKAFLISCASLSVLSTFLWPPNQSVLNHTQKPWRAESLMILNNWNSLWIKTMSCLKIPPPATVCVFQLWATGLLYVEVKNTSETCHKTKRNFIIVLLILQPRRSWVGFEGKQHALPVRSQKWYAVFHPCKEKQHVYILGKLFLNLLSFSQAVYVFVWDQNLQWVTKSERCARR